MTLPAQLSSEAIPPPQSRMRGFENHEEDTNLGGAHAESGEYRSDDGLIEAGACTSIGPKRARDEDYLVCAPLPNKETLFVLADGMGGHEAGDVTSYFAGDVFSSKVAQYRSQGLDYRDSFKKAVREAEELTRQKIPKNSGTTIVAAIVDNQGNYHIFNIGDSRAYLTNQDGTFHRITVDQEAPGGFLINSVSASRNERRVSTTSDLQKYVDMGWITSANTYFRGSLRPGQRLILACDGLNTIENQIPKLARKKSPPKAAKEIVKQANKQDGSDNASAIVIRANRQNQQINTIAKSSSPETDAGKGSIVETIWQKVANLSTKDIKEGLKSATRQPMDWAKRAWAVARDSMHQSGDVTSAERETLEEYRNLGIQAILDRIKRPEEGDNLSALNQALLIELGLVAGVNPTILWNGFSGNPVQVEVVGHRYNQTSGEEYILILDPNTPLHKFPKTIELDIRTARLQNRHLGATPGAITYALREIANRYLLANIIMQSAKGEDIAFSAMKFSTGNGEIKAVPILFTSEAKVWCITEDGSMLILPHTSLVSHESNAAKAQALASIVHRNRERYEVFSKEIEPRGRRRRT